NRAAVPVDDLNAGTPVVALSVGGKLLLKEVQGEGAVIPRFIGIGGEAPVLELEQEIHIGIRNPLSIVKMKKIPVPAYLHQIRAVFGFQNKRIAVCLISNCHLVYFPPVIATPSINCFW